MTTPEDNPATARLTYVERTPVELPSRRSGRPWLFAVIGLLLVAATYLGLQAVHALPSFLNPFDQQTTVRASPVTIESLRDMSRYVAAEGDFQVVVEVQQGRDHIPQFLYGERTVLVAVGTVEALVDFAALADQDLVVSGNSVHLTLPAPTLGDPALDTGRSYIVAHDSGVANRIAGLFGDEQLDQVALYQEADRQISGAAVQSDLRTRAQANTTQMLTALFRRLGYDQVTITYRSDPS